MKQHPKAMRDVLMPKRLLAGLGLCVASAIAGCSTSSLLDSELPVPTNYVIAPLPPAAGPTQSPALQVDIAIGRPDAAPGLDTSRIAVLRGRQLDYYRDVQWGGNSLEIVQTLLVNSLQDQQLFRSVTSEQTRVASAYMLDSEVRDFQAEYADGKDEPLVRVTIIGRLIRIADRALVDTIPATATRAATDNRMTAVAEAFEATAHEVARTIAREAAAAVSRDRDRILAIPTPSRPPP
jgi:cholesterol transport system auxiliary component